VPIEHVTTPLLSEQPLEAVTNVSPLGIVSLIVTPVASAPPTFSTVTL
jgi:hypothetical protein